jgi:hypothetical protein
MPPFKASLILTLSLLSSAWSSVAWSSIDSSLAVKFYRNPRSLFPSGEINRKELEKNWQQDFSESSYLVQRDKRQFWVKAASVARDLQLSQTVHSNRTQKDYQVRQVAGAFILGSTDGKAPEWLPLSDLSPLPQDLGVAMTLTNTQLHEKPNWKSDSILSVPSGSRLQILNLDDTWAEVTFESVGKITGWVDLNNLILKYDFASFASVDQKSWIPILYREGSELVSGDHKRIPLEKVKALVTKPNLAISIVTDDSEKLLLRQNLTLLRTEFQSWSRSRIAGHGDVFWKKDFNPELKETNLESGISFEELMKRDIVAVSFHPKNSNLAIASAQGIFLTMDGKKWKKLPIFQSQNHPVLIDAQGSIYVGSQRSQDDGKSFSPFFRWESLTPLVEQRQKSAVQQLKIRSLASPRPGILKMEVETNLGAISLAARSNQGLIQKWDFD